VCTVCCPALYYGRWWALTTKECDPQIRQSNPQEISYLRVPVTSRHRGYWPLCSQEHIVSQFNLVYAVTPRFLQTYYTRSFLITALVVRGAGIAQMVQRLATGWTVRGSNPGGGGEIFRTRPDQPWDPPSLLYNGYRVFTGGKAAGAWR